MTLGRGGGPFGRIRVYETSQGLDIDEFESLSIRRRRVLWGDVRLLTLHHMRRWQRIVALGGLGALLVLLSWTLGPGAGTWLALVGAVPCLTGAALEWSGVDVVTVQGIHGAARLEVPRWLGGGRSEFDRLARRIELRGAPAGRRPGQQP